MRSYTTALKNFLMAGVGRAASILGLPEIKARVDRQTTVTPKAGARGDTHRRIIAHNRQGPFYRQTGIKWTGPREALPIMQTYFTDTFLHATKGPRTYTGRLPMAQQSWWSRGKAQRLSANQPLKRMRKGIAGRYAPVQA